MWKPIVEHKETQSQRAVGEKLADLELDSPPWYPTIHSGGERVACQRALCDWAKVEEYVKFKMKRQPSQLKAELGANGAGERGPFQRKVIICKLISPQQTLPGPLAKGIPGPRPSH